MWFGAMPMPRRNGGASRNAVYVCVWGGGGRGRCDARNSYILGPPSLGEELYYSRAAITTSPAPTVAPLLPLPRFRTAITNLSRIHEDLNRTRAAMGFTAGQRPKGSVKVGGKQALSAAKDGAHPGGGIPSFFVHDLSL